MKNEKVSEFLEKYKQLDRSTLDMLWHLNIKDAEVSKIKEICGIPDKTTENETATRIAESIKSCYSFYPNYNEKLYLTLGTLGNGISIFPKHNHNIWNNGLFEDDEFGISNNVTSIYDQNIDSFNDYQHYSHTL